VGVFLSFSDFSPSTYVAGEKRAGERGFCCSGGRGVKAKQQGSTNDTTKDTIAVPSTGDGPVLSSLVDHTVEKMIDSRNNIGMHDGNVASSTTG
ncbi:hypothetical protein Tco_0579965, partial [Tanacetum coccineum]